MVTGDLSCVLLAETLCVCVCVWESGCRCAFIRFLNSSICFVRYIHVFVVLNNIVCTVVSV